VSAAQYMNSAVQVRVVSMYATRWRDTGMGPSAAMLDLDLGVLTRFYDFYKDRLPGLLRRVTIDADDVRFMAPEPAVSVVSAEVSLFALPSNQIVCEATLIVRSDPFSTIKSGIAGVLEHCIQGDLLVAGRPLPDFIDDLARGVSAQDIPSEAAALLPERHLLIFMPRLAGGGAPPGPEVIEEIVYRDAPPYREEFTKLQLPEQLNQEGRTLGAVTPYVSLLYGHQKFVEDSVFLSTIQALGTASRFRQIWHEAYRQVQEFRSKNQREDVGEQTRDELEALADTLGNLEFDLTFSVEFPLIRIASFHSALFEALDLPAQTQTLSQMFTQLAGSLRSEITAIEIRERRRELYRRKWNAAAASIISLIGVPIGFMVAFFGINATQVDGSSIFNLDHYLWVYLFGVALAIVPASLIFYPYAREWLGNTLSRITGKVGAAAGKPPTPPPPAAVPAAADPAPASIREPTALRADEPSAR